MNEICCYYENAEVNLERTSITPKSYNSIPKLIETFRNLMYPEYLLVKRDWKRKIRKELKKFKRLLDSMLRAEECPKEKVSKVCKKLKILREISLTDAKAAYMNDPAARGYEEIIWAYPGLFAINVFRLAHVLYMLNIITIARIISEYAHSKTGIDIHPAAQVGEAFFIDHGTGIVIGETSIIGNNVKMYQGVTLGAITTKNVENLRGKKRHPTIGDNVTIYAGATILGGDTYISNNKVIKGSAFICKSV